MQKNRPIFIQILHTLSKKCVHIWGGQSSNFAHLTIRSTLSWSRCACGGDKAKKYLCQQNPSYRPDNNNL